MTTTQRRLRNAGFFAFFLSGICAISSGVIIPLLQERYGFAYSVNGTLLSCMNIGNLIAGFLAGLLPGRIGLRRTALLLGAGYALGYAVMGFDGWVPVLALGFLLVGLAKGSVINVCTVLVGDNSPNRTAGMNTMHACYACGALLCPFLAAAAGRLGDAWPMLALAVCGVALVADFGRVPFSPAPARGEREAIDWSFLRSRRFWLLVGLLFCQNAAETSVTGWMVTYFKDSGILSAAVSPYTVTILWGTTMAGRLFLAFVRPPKDAHRAMIVMALGTTVFYLALMRAEGTVAAMVLLFAFALFISGMNPTAVSCAGRMTSVTSLGVLLPAASLGAIVMPWVIGLVAEYAGIAAGMAVNLLPCAGMLLFALLVRRDAAGNG